MGAKPAGLTATKVKAAAPGRDGDGDGLHLYVRGAEAAFWTFRYTRAGRMREMGLGRARGKNAVTLAEAREKAAPLHKQVRAGLDPLAERDAAEAVTKAEATKAERRAITFRQVAEDHIADNAAGWHNAKHRAQWAATLKAYVYPRMGEVAVC